MLNTNIMNPSIASLGTIGRGTRIYACDNHDNAFRFSEFFHGDIITVTPSMRIIVRTGHGFLAQKVDSKIIVALK